MIFQDFSLILMHRLLGPSFSLWHMYWFWTNIWRFFERIWPFLSGLLKTYWLNMNIELGFRVPGLLPKIQLSKFAANKLCSNRKNRTFNGVLKTCECSIWHIQTIMEQLSRGWHFRCLGSGHLRNTFIRSSDRRNWL